MKYKIKGVLRLLIDHADEKELVAETPFDQDTPKQTIGDLIADMTWQLKTAWLLQHPDAQPISMTITFVDL